MRPQVLMGLINMSKKLQSLFSVFQSEAARLSSKGMSMLPAIVTLYTFFFILTPFLHKLYAQLPYQNMVLMYAGVSTLISATCFTAANIFFFVLYIKKLPYFEHYRISEAPWPWETDPEGYKLKLRGTLRTLLLNHLIILPGISYIGAAVLKNEMNLNLESLPSGKDLLYNILFFMIVEDFAFYWGHRLFHTPWMYKKFHKQHHEYKISIGLASSYAHPVEFTLGNLLPAALGPMMLGMNCHMFAWFVWVGIRTFETVDGHSGYDFPWSPFRLLPFSAGAAYHGYHHSHNIGNYGSFLTYLDTLFGTNRAYCAYRAKNDSLCNKLLR